MKHNDTIAAIATAPGISGIGIIRVSGNQSLSIAKKIFPKPHPLKPRYVHVGKFITADKRILDEGCMIYFQGPFSYTGEDCLECHLHGNPLILKLFLEELFKQGVRLATPGEFTQRALINGKITLTQAEAIDELIHTESELGHTVALNHLKGKLFSHIQEIRKDLMQILEHMEGSIDFPDEIDPIPSLELDSTIKKILEKINQFIDLQDFGKQIQSGIKCVILGKPNVGKSSLLNTIIGENRAIVSNIPGTTRDLIDAKLTLNGFIFEFIDTAGIRESTDKIEKLGIKKIKDLFKSADLLCWVLDTSRPLDEEDKTIFKKIKKQKNIVIILNKSDKSKKLTLSPEILSKNWPQISISTRKDPHLIELKKWLTQHFTHQAHKGSLDLICNARQLACLKESQKSLKNVSKGIKSKFEDAMLVIDIKESIVKLGEITGDELTEEVLDGVFSRFCVGK